MKTDYYSWKTRLLSIENLKLDVDNPRFSYQSKKLMNQTEIVRYLVENYGVYELAKSIATSGYFLNEEPIVCKEGDYYVVLEGNRRVAACKLLLNPYKFLSGSRAKELSKIGSIENKIRCIISPTRRDADALIYNKHTGIPLQKWDKVSQDAFLVNLIRRDQLSIEVVAKKFSVSATEIRKALRRYAVHQYCIHLFQNDASALQQIQDGFPITNFERFYEDERGLNFLGIGFNKDGSILKCLPEEEFNKRFSFIVTQILNQDLTSRTFNNAESKEEYFSSINEFDKVKFDLSITANNHSCDNASVELEEDASEDFDIGEEEQDVVPKGKRTRKKPGLFADYDWSGTGLKKIDALFRSIQSLNYKKHPDLSGIALRCYVDMVVYNFLLRKKCIQNIQKDEVLKNNENNDKKFNALKEYLKRTYSLSDDEINDDELRSYSRFTNKENNIKIPELGNMVNYIIQHHDLLNNDTRLIQVLDKFKKSHGDFIDLTACNMFVHNQYYQANVLSLESSANDLAAVLDAMYNSIKNGN